MNRRDALKGLTATALTPVLASVAGARSFQEERKGTLILVNAPIRQALEMLFTVYKRQYNIDNTVSGFVSLNVRNQPFEAQLSALLKSGKTPLNRKWDREVEIITTLPTPENLPQSYQAASERPSLKNPNAGPYRVLGVWYEQTKQGSLLTPMAIVEFAPPDSGAEIYVVKPGDALPVEIVSATKAPAQFTDLRVEQVRPVGVTLIGKAKDGNSVRVPVELPGHTHFRIGQTF